MLNKSTVDVLVIKDLNSNATPDTALVRNIEHVQTAELTEWSDFHFFCEQFRDLCFQSRGFTVSSSYCFPFFRFLQAILNHYQKIFGLL